MSQPIRCPAATEGFPYEHLHQCTKRLDHRLHDEPDNDVHLCSCGARWRPQRLDTNPRIAAYVAARRWAADHGHQTPDDRMLALVYDAGRAQVLDQVERIHCGCLGYPIASEGET